MRVFSEIRGGVTKAIGSRRNQGPTLPADIDGSTSIVLAANSSTAPEVEPSPIVETIASYIQYLQKSRSLDLTGSVAGGVSLAIDRWLGGVDGRGNERGNLKDWEFSKPQRLRYELSKLSHGQGVRIDFFSQHEDEAHLTPEEAQRTIDFLNQIADTDLRILLSWREAKEWAYIATQGLGEWDGHGRHSIVPLLTTKRIRVDSALIREGECTCEIYLQGPANFGEDDRNAEVLTPEQRSACLAGFYNVLVSPGIDAQSELASIRIAPPDLKK